MASPNSRSSFTLRVPLLLPKLLLITTALSVPLLMTECHSHLRARRDLQTTDNAWTTLPQQPANQSLLFGNRSRGWYAMGLLPVPLDLAADSFSSTYDAAGQPRTCDQRTILAASIQTFGLPRVTQSFTLLAVLGPPRREPGALQGDLMTAGGLRVQWDLSANAIRLFASWDASASVVAALPSGGGANTSSSWPFLTFSLSRRADGALGVCFNGAPMALQQVRPTASRQAPGGWLSGSPLGNGWSLASTDRLQLGDPRAATTLNTRLQQLWIVNTAWNCTEIANIMSYKPGAAAATGSSAGASAAAGGLPAPAGASGAAAPAMAAAAVPPALAAQPYQNSLPVLLRLDLSVEGEGTGADGEAFVGQSVTVTGEVYDADGDALRVRLTWYGVPASGCKVASCGDEGRTVASTMAGRALVSQSVTYKLPGRYTVRLEASDQTGAIVAKDVQVLVRKVGDVGRQAPCCRSTGMVIAAQTGRPVHSSRFRDPLVTGLATSALGWSTDYLAAEDMEVERLFDFGVLAPRHDPLGLQLSTCLDAFLAGPGSPRVLSGSFDQRSVTTGHGKRLLVVPQGFSWGPRVASNQTESPYCESHWTQWAADSPYKMPSGFLLNGTRSYCTFTCTPNGTRALQLLAGMTDRLAEAMAELSYGRLSLSWDVDVTDTLLMPQNTTLDPFAYSDSPVGPFLTSSGVDRAAYHSLVVLSPAPPRRINPGYTAWSAVGAGTMFVMRCMPQLYYLVHEMGHLLGLPHADIWRLDNATIAPSDPAGPGGPQDTYSDKLDMMACCRGDYGALSRIWLGWMPYPERLHIPLTATTSFSSPRPPSPPDPSPAVSPTRPTTSPSRPPPLSPRPPPPFSAPMLSGSPTTNSSTTTTAPIEDATAGCDPSGPNGCSYTLWPVDRSESRGQLKALSVRISDAQLVVLSYKALPWWQDMRLGRDPWDAGDRDNLIADEMRSPLTGLSAEYMRKTVNSNGVSSFGSRGLLDFNVLFGEWPSALPPAPATLPPAPARSAFALLKEGQAWLHAGGALLVVAQQEVDCDGQAEVPVHNYSVPNFYGFRGESPGAEGFRRSDYNGYAGGLRCLKVAVRTQMPPQTRPGKLNVRLRVLGSEAKQPLDLRGTCGFPLLPRLQVLLPTELASTNPAGRSSSETSGASGALPPGLASVVWKDPRNVTFASGTLEATLPPFSDSWLQEASAGDSPPCVYGCDALYRVRVASYDGAQTLVSVRVVQVSLRYILLYTSYRYYQLDAITTDSELLYVPVVAPWTQPAVLLYGSPSTDKGDVGSVSSWQPAATDPRDTAWGLQLLGDGDGSRRLSEQPAVTWPAEQLPYTACSRQFSLTIIFKMRLPVVRVGRWQLATMQLAPDAAGGGNQGLKLWVMWNASTTAAATFTTDPAADGSDGTTATAAPLSLAVSQDPYRQATVAMALPAPGDERLYRVALVYDAGRVGIWVDGGGGWPWRDAACAPPRSGVTYCNNKTPGGGSGSGGGAAAATGDGQLTGPQGALRGISLLGATSDLDALLLSARIYNYALPRADFTDEATCLLMGNTQQGCVARFGLRTGSAAATTAAAWIPPQQSQVAVAAAETSASGNASMQEAMMAFTAPPGAVVVPVEAGQRAGWDLLAANAAATLAFPPGPTPRTRYRLQVGNWSACSATCGGGVSLRPLICQRAANRGPWAVNLDDCPLSALPDTVVVCNSQPCPSRWPALTAVPGPSGCLQLAAAPADCSSGSGSSARRLQPMCVQSGGAQLPLGSCLGTIATAAAAAAVGRMDTLPGWGTTGAIGTAGRPAAESTTVSASGKTVTGSTWESLILVVNASDSPSSAIAPPSGRANVSEGSSGDGDSLHPKASPSLRILSLREAVLQDMLQESCTAAAAAAAASGDGGSLSSPLPLNQSANTSCRARPNEALVWRFGSWSTCRIDCSSGSASSSSGGDSGDGIRERGVKCINETSGQQLDAAVCTAVLGPPPPAMLRSSCGGRACGVVAWQLSPWSACETHGSVMGFGRAVRVPSCVVARAGSGAQCGVGTGVLSVGQPTSWPLVLSSICSRSSGAVSAAAGAPWWAPCMVPTLVSKEAACFGNGVCSYVGCICKPGYTGQMCEVHQGALPAGPSPPSLATANRTPGPTPSEPASSSLLPATELAATAAATATATGTCTSGIVNREGGCCPTGLLTTDGTCCTAALGISPSLDGAGRCCNSSVDVCGVCGGSGVVVDVQGTCCRTALDQYGVCCASGLLDECGVCDGDGTSCVLRLQLQLQLASASAWSMVPATAATAAHSTGTAASATASASAVNVMPSAASNLQNLLRFALGPVQGSVSISLTASAVDPSTSQVSSLAVTYDIVYDDGSWDTPAGPVNGDDSEAPMNVSEAGLLWPLGPYNFTTVAVGVRLEGLRNAVQQHLGVADVESGSVPPASPTASQPLAPVAALQGSSDHVIAAAKSQLHNYSDSRDNAAATNLAVNLEEVSSNSVSSSSEDSEGGQQTSGEEDGSWGGSEGAVPYPQRPALLQQRTAAVDESLAASGSFRIRSQQPISHQQQQLEEEAGDAPHIHAEMQQMIWSARHLNAAAATVGVPVPADNDGAERPAADNARPSRSLHYAPYHQDRVLSAASTAALGSAEATSPKAPPLAATAPPPVASEPPPDGPLELWATTQVLLRSSAAREAAAMIGLLAVEVYGIERLGVCGNGVCEVGEQVWPGATEAAGELATVEPAGCPQDCPLTLRLCPASSDSGFTATAGGSVSDVRQCSGRGVCLLSSGVCTCFEGYGGDACELCAPGFQRAMYGDAAGLCVRQYIRGRTVLEWDALAGTGQVAVNGFLRHVILMACLVTGSVVLLGLSALSAATWIKRRKRLAALGIKQLEDAAVSRERSMSATVPDAEANTDTDAGASAATKTKTQTKTAARIAASERPSSVTMTPRRRNRRTPRAARSLHLGVEVHANTAAELDSAAEVEVEADTATPLVSHRRRALVHVDATADDDGYRLPDAESRQARPTSTKVRTSRSISAPANSIDVSRQEASPGAAATGTATTAPAAVAAAEAAAVYTQDQLLEGTDEWASGGDQQEEEEEEEEEAEACVGLQAAAARPHYDSPCHPDTSPALRSCDSRASDHLAAPRRRDMHAGPQQHQLENQRQQRQQERRPERGQQRMPLGEAIEVRTDGLGSFSGSRPEGGPEGDSRQGRQDPIILEGEGGIAAPKFNGSNWGGFLRQWLWDPWPGSRGLTRQDVAKMTSDADGVASTAAAPDLEIVLVTAAERQGRGCQQQQLQQLQQSAQLAMSEHVSTPEASWTTVTISAVMQEQEENAGDNGRSPCQTPAFTRPAGSEWAPVRAGGASCDGIGPGHPCSPPATQPLWGDAAVAPAALAASPTTRNLWRTPASSLVMYSQPLHSPTQLSRSQKLELRRSRLEGCAAVSGAQFTTPGPYPLAAVGAAAAAAAAPVATDLMPRNLAAALFAAAQPWPLGSRSLLPTSPPLPSASASATWRWWSPARNRERPSAGGSGGGAREWGVAMEGPTAGASSPRPPPVSPSHAAATPFSLETVTPAPTATLTVATRRNRTGSTNDSAGGGAMASPRTGGANTPSSTMMGMSPRLTMLRNLETGLGAGPYAFVDASVVKSPRRALLQPRGHFNSKDQ